VHAVLGKGRPVLEAHPTGNFPQTQELSHKWQVGMSPLLLLFYLVNLSAYMYSPPFLSHKDLHITKHADQLIKILQDKQIPVEKVIEVLKEQLAIEQEVRLKALVKEKAKEKCKSTESLTNLFVPTHDINNTRLDAMSLCKVVLKN
jgi:hypothetical protein